jgi:hypothetical protein
MYADPQQDPESWLGRVPMATQEDPEFAGCFVGAVDASFMYADLQLDHEPWLGRAPAAAGQEHPGCRATGAGTGTEAGEQDGAAGEGVSLEVSALADALADHSWLQGIVF